MTMPFLPLTLIPAIEASRTPLRSAAARRSRLRDRPNFEPGGHSAADLPAILASAGPGRPEAWRLSPPIALEPTASTVPGGTAADAHGRKN
jgi:hypothetical protein